MDRIAACWFSDKAFDIGTTDGKEHLVAVCFIDWDALGRAVKVEVRDAVMDAVLDTQTVMDFKNGKYPVWNIKGQASFHFISIGKENATVSGPSHAEILRHAGRRERNARNAAG